MDYYNPLKTPKDVAKYALQVHARIGCSVDEYPYDRWEFASLLQAAGFDGHGMEGLEFDQLLFMTLWLKYGMPVYRPTLDLAAGLAMTDPSDVRGEDWKLPYGAFLIHVPYDLWVTGGLSGDEREACGGGIVMLAVQLSAIRGRDTIFVSAWAREGAGMFTRAVAPRDDELLGDWIARNANKAAPDGQWELEESERNTSAALLRLIINLCLYVTDRGPGRPEPHHTTKAARRRRERHSDVPSEPEVWILGKEIHLDKEVLAAARARATGTRAEWKIASSCVVQGHHKMQVHGPGRVLRKRIWVEPYRRGEGPRLTHMYVVGTEDE